MPLFDADIRQLVIYVSLNGGDDEPPYPEISGDLAAVKARTLGDWKLDHSKARRCDVIAGVYETVVRAVFGVRGERCSIRRDRHRQRHQGPLHRRGPTSESSFGRKRRLASRRHDSDLLRWRESCSLWASCLVTSIL